MQAAGAFAPFRFANRRKALVVTYHRFSTRRAFGRTEADDFAQQLDYLTRRYKVIKLSALADLMSRGSTLPPGLAAITIDDGYADAYEIAFPILKQKRVPASLFAVTGFIDRTCWLWPDKVRYATSSSRLQVAETEVNGQMLRFTFSDPNDRRAAAERINAALKPMPEDERNNAIARVARDFGAEAPDEPPAAFGPLTWNQLREMDAAGVEIGSHTVTHPILNRVTNPQLECELSDSRERLESELDRKVDLFCYPNGDSSPEIERKVAEAGYRAAVTTRASLNRAGENMLALARIPGDGDLGHLAQATSGFEEIKNRVLGTRGFRALYGH